MLALIVQCLLELLRCDALLFEKQLSDSNRHLPIAGRHERWPYLTESLDRSLRLSAPAANHARRGTAARLQFSACTVLPDRVETTYVCELQAVSWPRDTIDRQRSCDGIKGTARPEQVEGTPCVPPSLARDWAAAHKEQNWTFDVLGD